MIVAGDAAGGLALAQAVGMIGVGGDGVALQIAYRDQPALAVPGVAVSVVFKQVPGVVVGKA